MFNQQDSLMRRKVSFSGLVMMIIALLFASSEGMTAEPFAVKKVRTVFSDTFNKPDHGDPNVPKGWSHWQPTTDSGKCVYERSYGRQDSSSLCFIDPQRSVWQQKLPVRPGAMYRLSGWVSVERKSTSGTVALGMIPKVISSATGKEIFLGRHGVRNEVRLSPGYWTYLEVFWTCPASGEYPEGKFSGIDVEFFGSKLNGKAWGDDIVLDQVVTEQPFCDNFEIKGAALRTWEIHSFHGLEGQAQVEHDAEGFADSGALHIKHIRGTPGFSAATVLSRNRFGAKREWTFLSHGRALKEGNPVLGVQQLDAAGKILQQKTEDPGKDKGNGNGWAERRLTFSLLPGTKQVRLLLTNNGTGSAVFDNVWLRPALRSETAVSETKYAIRVGVNPADIIAAIDKTPPVITVPAGQTTAINIHLAGENRPDDTTIVDIDMPDWLELQTAQQSIYGTEPLPWKKIDAEKEDRVIYRFTNPYNWQRGMVRGDFNPYHGLILVFRTNATPGTEGTILIRTQLGKDNGQERKLKTVVRESISPAPLLKTFRVGIWGISFIHVRDESARKELLKTYTDAGIRVGSMHQTHGFAIGTFKELGFKPTQIILDPSSPIPYKGLPAAERPDMAVLTNGNNSSHHVALGLALNDPEVHIRYKEYLKKYIVLPLFSSYIVMDIEFWGEGSTDRMCFHPSTIASFRKYANIPASVTLSSEVILKQYYKQWSDFRNWVTAELHGLMRRLMREIRPDLLLLAYDYPLAIGGKPQSFVTDSPVNTLLYEPHIDIHLVSYYNREGFNFLDAVDNDARHLKKPVWTIPFLMKNINNIHRKDYNYSQISARELRFEIVGAAASGAKGHLGFPGKLMDADYLQAYHDGVTAVDRYEDFYMDGVREDKKVALVNPDRNVRCRVHALGDKLLLTLFNCSENNLNIAFKYAGKSQIVSVNALNFKQVELK
ncbi:hypothetical protein KKC91_06040 [bacterium]|nr:hypothetical protein [bacterium]